MPTLPEKALALFEVFNTKAAEWNKKPVEDRERVVIPLINLIMILIIRRSAPRALVKLSAALDDIGYDVPTLTLAEAKRVCHPLASLLIGLAFRIKLTRPKRIQPISKLAELKTGKAASA